MITSKTHTLALFGDPVSHSLSPLMHNAWLAAAKIDAVYVALRITNASAFAELRHLGLRGANVTVPHKEAAARACDTLDETASVMGAANVLRWEADGALSGFNTDGAGLVASLDEAAPQWRAGKTALILGAGGAGKGAAFALKKAGLCVRIANRTQARAEAVAQQIGAETHDWRDLSAAFADADVIINTTTLGMKSSPAMDWPLASARDHAIVLDAVYAPLETPLLRAAKARGLVGVDGLGMLIHQGAAAFKLWFGAAPDTKAARALLLKAIPERGA